MLLQLFIGSIFLIMWNFITNPLRKMFATQSSDSKILEVVNVASKSEKKATSSEKVEKAKYADVLSVLKMIIALDKELMSKMKENKKLINSDTELYKLLFSRMQAIQDLSERYTFLFDEAIKENDDFSNVLLLKHPYLSDKEVRLCYYFRLHLSSKEISALEGLTSGSVRVYKTKIKSKMKLDPTESLSYYLNNMMVVA
jgi:DNA-binding NarL/FixJ family response regulator